MCNGGRGRGGNYQGLPKNAGNGPENWSDENWGVENWGVENWGAENWTGNSYESWDTGQGRGETENWGGNGRWNEDWHGGRGWSGEVGCANGSRGRGWNNGWWDGGHRGRGRGFRGGFRGGRGSYPYNADRPEKEGKTVATQTKACLFGEKATQTDLTFGEAENEDGNDWVTVLRRNQNRINAANNTPNNAANNTANNAGKNGNNKDFREFLDDP